MATVKVVTVKNSTLTTGDMVISQLAEYPGARTMDVYWSTNSSGSDVITTAVNGTSVYLIVKVSSHLDSETATACVHADNIVDSFLEGVSVHQQYKPPLIDNRAFIRVGLVSVPAGRKLNGAFAIGPSYVNPTPLTIIG